MQSKYFVLFLSLLMAMNQVCGATVETADTTVFTQSQGGLALPKASLSIVDRCAYTPHSWIASESLGGSLVIRPITHTGVRIGESAARKRQLLYRAGTGFVVTGAAAFTYLAFAPQIHQFLHGYINAIPTREPLYAHEAATTQGSGKPGSYHWTGSVAVIDGIAPTPDVLKKYFISAAKSLIGGAISLYVLQITGLDQFGKMVKDFGTEIMHPKIVLKKSKEAFKAVDTYVKDLMDIGDMSVWVYQELIAKIDSATKALEASLGFVQYTIGKNSDMVKQAKYNCFYQYLSRDIYPRLNQALTKCGDGTINMQEVHRLVAVLSRETDVFFTSMVK